MSIKRVEKKRSKIMQHRLKIVLLIFMALTFLHARGTIKCAVDNCKDQTSTLFCGVPLKAASNLSPELIVYFLKEGSEIIELIEKIDQAIQGKIGIRCGGCKTNILSCAELAGHLCASGDQKNLDELKKLLLKQNVQEINNFMVTVAQEKQIACVLCEKFVQWT